MNYLSIVIIFGVAMVIGMTLALILKPRLKYHGPNAALEIKKSFYDSKSKKCFRFGIIRQKCPGYKL